MSKYKYPYIPKKYYLAVMFACKLIREYGYFNRAIKIASGYYKVDPDEIEAHVRARQAAGQKEKEWDTYKKYRFKGKYSVFNDGYYCEPETPFDHTIKAINLRNAKKRLYNILFNDVDRYYYDTSIEFEIDGEEV